MKTTTTTEPKRFTLYGNLGDDPKAHTIPAKTFTKMVYDEIIDDAVEKEFTYEERHFLTYSVATGGYDDKPTRWIYCVDWEGCAFRARKGDRLELYGYFEERSYIDKNSNEVKTIRQFVVENSRIVFLKVRKEAA
jgi:single-stranded DNA-binding protein